MARIVTYRYFSFMLHALAWSLVLFLPYLVSDAREQYKIGPLPGLYFTLSGVVHMIVFYGNALLLYPKLLRRVYWPFYIVSLVVMVFLSYQLKLYILATLFPGASPDTRTHVLFPSVVAFIASVFYSITVDKIREERNRKENEAMLLGVELKFLRSQISPHFIFNVLTNLVSLARKKSDHLESSILMLSGLMRYMLYDTGKKITLQQEAEYLESYVTLQKLRFGHTVEIRLDQSLSDEALESEIEPMLFIPFVENAFKHGTGCIERPFITVQLTGNSNSVNLEVKNKFNNEMDKVKDRNSGIGLTNVRSRLRLLYPGRHDLAIEKDKKVFKIHLTLQLV